MLPREGVALFPGDSCIVDLRCRLPLEFPAGARRAAIEVRDSIGDLVPALVEFDLLVEPVEQLQLRVEPTNINAGRRGTFTATSPTTATRRWMWSCAPSTRRRSRRRSSSRRWSPILPNAVGVARAELRGKRPWFGTPVVRLLTVGVAAAAAPAPPPIDPLAPEGARPGATSTLVAVVQRPRLSRRLMTLLGLLLAATVFTVVLAATFANLAKQSNANAALLKEIARRQPDGQRASVDPPTLVSGTVTSSTGKPRRGVAIVLYDKGRGPSVTIAQTVTDGNGKYRLANVAGGTYRIKFSAAGFTDVWYDGAPSFEEAKDVVVAAGTADPGARRADRRAAGERQRQGHRRRRARRHGRRADPGGGAAPGRPTNRRRPPQRGRLGHGRRRRAGGADRGRGLGRRLHGHRPADAEQLRAHRHQGRLRQPAARPSRSSRATSSRTSCSTC